MTVGVYSLSLPDPPPPKKKHINILSFAICIIRVIRGQELISIEPLQDKALPAAMCYFSGVGVRTKREQHLCARVCAYSRVKGPTWRGPLSLGEEQELVVKVEDGEEE